MQFNIPAEFKNASGVYIIRNTVNEKVYVGSTVCFLRRFREHLKGLTVGTHHAKKLQNFASKYGCNVLTFDLLEVTSSEKSQIISCEQKWINTLCAHERQKGFNTLPTAGSCLGTKWSPERKAKAKETRKPHTLEQRVALSAALKGRIVSKETRAKMAASRRGQKLNLTDEQRKKVLQKLAGRLTPEAEQKRKANHKAYYEAKRATKPPEPERPALPIGCKRPPLSEEHKQKIAAARKGQQSNRKGILLSEEHKQKISAAQKGRKHTEEAKQKMSAAQKGRPHTKEHNERVSTALKGRLSLMRGRNLSEKTKARVAANIEGRQLSEDNKRKLWTPEANAKRAATLQAKYIAKCTILPSQLPLNL